MRDPKPTVRQLLARIAHNTSDSPRNDAAEALAALDAEEGRTVVAETDAEGTCYGCALESRGGLCLGYGSRMFTSRITRPKNCPLNNGGQVLVRLAVVG